MVSHMVSMVNHMVSVSMWHALCVKLAQAQASLCRLSIINRLSIALGITSLTLTDTTCKLAANNF